MRLIRTRLLKKNLITSAIISCVFLPLLAQETIIKGQVTDKENKPLADVQITFHDLTRGIKFSVKTKKDGTYFKIGLPPSTYKVTVKAEGYFPFETNLSIEFGREQIANFILEKSPPKVEDDPDFKEGLKAFETGDLEAAVAAFKRTVERLPQSLEANYNLAICYLRLEKTVEAINILEKILSWKKDVPEIYLALGEAYFNLAETEKALSSFHRAQELQPDNPRIYYDLGLIYYKNERLDEAIASFDKAKSLNPEFSSIYYQLGLTFLKKGDYPKAIENLEKFLQLEPEAKEAPQVRLIIEELRKRYSDSAPA
ncbi:MAG: tetratricopeptide repeat protein [Candidatus Aminicenantes bacterium]|nr:tetratricopeptide repeat protein [Candidatus Aminicenantes bacterium]